MKTHKERVSSWRVVVGGPRVWSIAAIAGLWLACGGGAPSTGTMNVRMVDGPTDAFSEINVEVRRVEISASGEGWVTLGSPNRVINLLSLRGGVSAALASGATLAAGHYGQMRLVLGSNNTVKLDDGSVEPLKVPSGMQSGIKLTVSFDVTVGTTKDVVIDFDARNSIHLNATGNGKYILRPTIRAFDVLATGSISGRVTASGSGASVGGAVITAQTIDGSGQASIARSTISAADGAYTLDLLPAGGTYFVVCQAVSGDVSYEAFASGAIAINASTPTARFVAQARAALATGGIAGTITPVATVEQGDEVAVRQRLDAGGTLRVFIVRTTTASVTAQGETYAFASLPVGLYDVAATRIDTSGAGGAALLVDATSAASVSVGLTAQVALAY